MKGESLALPRHRVERELTELIQPAALALKQILSANPHSYESTAASAFSKVQLTAAIYTLDACKGIASESGKQTRKAAQILASVGGDAINRELMRRYAAKQRSSERQRIVQAVEAVSEGVANDAADGGEGVARETSAADGGSDSDTPPPTAAT